MLRWMIKRQLDRFERAFDYDVSYMRQIASVSLPAFLRFSRVLGMTEHREGAPVAAFYAAKLVGALAEDCGPCTQLIVRMAERAGVAPDMLAAVLRGDVQRMGEAAALGWRFARAALAHDPECDLLRGEVVEQWGEPAAVSLAFALAGGRLFPTIKYALGHGHACTRVRVGGVEIVPAAAAPALA